jgi:predicted alpha/beta-fold hydrolase
MEEIEKIKSIRAFNEQVIFTFYGYHHLTEYYSECSCDQFMPKISVPTFIGNAWNNPFLGKGSYPMELARNHSFIYLEIPKYGEHCGFTSSNN